MANDIQLNEFKLKDPVTSLPDGLREPLQKPPGFFRSLRDPRDLWLEESLPASMYQWMTGNTKKKQAEEALKFLKSYPHLQDQLDMQYWDEVNGTSKWKDCIAKVKSDVPKK